MPHVKYATIVRLVRLHFSFMDHRYQGDMDRRKRDQAVRVFMSKEKARVMLMSLKCGGACV